MRANVGANQLMEYLWTEQYDYGRGLNTLNVCGVQFGN
jgi:hypothetical protein